MSLMTFRPLETWPGDKTEPRKSGNQFKASWSGTLQLLDRELRMLDADSVVLQVSVSSARDIRIDGMLRADAKPTWPGVILSFESAKGSLSFPCDTYTKWQHNVRAIALALEALRAVDRYGVTRQAEQYRGWDRIGHQDEDAPMDVHRAAEILAQITKDRPLSLLENVGLYQKQMRAAMVHCHPDRGGDSEMFRKLVNAKELLDAHHERN